MSGSGTELKSAPAHKGRQEKGLRRGGGSPSPLTLEGGGGIL